MSIKWFGFLPDDVKQTYVPTFHTIYSWSLSTLSLFSKPPAYVCWVPSCGFAHVDSRTGLQMCIGHTYITQYFVTNFRQSFFSPGHFFFLDIFGSDSTP